jgi:hypothetical protein
MIAPARSYLPDFVEFFGLPYIRPKYCGGHIVFTQPTSLAEPTHTRTEKKGRDDITSNNGNNGDGGDNAAATAAASPTGGGGAAKTATTTKKKKNTASSSGEKPVNPANGTRQSACSEVPRASARVCGAAEQVRRALLPLLPLLPLLHRPLVVKQWTSDRLWGCYAWMRRGAWWMDAASRRRH